MPKKLLSNWEYNLSAKYIERIYKIELVVIN